MKEKHFNATHGQFGTRLYQTWVMMKQRCLNSNNPSYPLYGGRGIKVCERWLVFENFAMDMGPRPDGMELERLDNNGDYEKANCKWETHKRNCRNKRNMRLIQAFGQTLCLSEWSEKTGMPPRTIYSRLRRGWSPERSVSP